MADETKGVETGVAPKTRRTIIKAVAQVAVTAPAVVILLDAKPAKAVPGLPYGGPILSGDSVPVANEGLIDDGFVDQDVVN